MMKNILIVIAIIAVFTGLSIWNYRRFMGHPLTLSSPGFSIDTKPFSCNHNGKTIRGEILLPKGKEGKLPTIIICHGLGSRYTLSKILAGTTLAQSGFACVVFDFYGGNTKSISGGTMLEMSIFTEKEDLNAVTDAVKKLDFVDTDRLFLLGESQGGLVSAITANERDDYKAMILYYPAFIIPDNAQKMFKSKEDIPETVRFGTNTMGRKYYADVLGWDIYSHIGGYRKDVLIIHGNGDKLIDVSCAYKAKEIYDKAELVILEGQPHGFDGKGKEEAVQLVYDFLMKHI